MILEPPSPSDTFSAPRPPSAEFLHPPLLRKSSSGDCGLAIELIKNLSFDNAPVSEIMMAESSDAAKHLVAPQYADAALTLWQCARELSVDACFAAAVLHARHVPLSYVVLARSEAGAKLVALAQCKDDALALELAAHCAALWRDAREGASSYLWTTPRKTSELVEAHCRRLCAARRA
mmetsp:Transcript_20817/g.62124  ORF Transcript_20817/g.62124 Transcript_20817/m.62124 type:complete len:178 (-) Transcript_20817:105-638(-)